MIKRSNKDNEITHCSTSLNSLVQTENVERECMKFELISNIPQKVIIAKEYHIQDNLHVR